MVKIKAADLRKKDDNELKAQLKEVKSSLLALRLAKATNATAAKLGEIKQSRRNVARVLTVVRQRLRDQVKEKYKTSKYKPLDLRPKLTRKLRRQAKLDTRVKLTLRQKKQRTAFPPRKYALKA